MTELYEWAEKQALENLRFHIQSAELIAKEANTTLTVFLAGVGGASAYSVKLMDTHAPLWLLAATIVFGMCLLFLAGWLILGCLKIEAIAAPTNEPRNIYRSYFPALALKEAELNNMQVRIDDTVKRNERVAERLNRIRLLALVTPFIAAVVGGLVWVSL